MKRKKQTNKFLVNKIGLRVFILLILTLIFTIPMYSGNSQDTTNNITNDFLDIKQFFYSGDYIEKINGVPRDSNITIMEIPSIGESVEIIHNQSVNMTPVIYIRMGNPEKINTETSYYYKSPVYMVTEFETIDSPKSKEFASPIFLVMNPYDFGGIYLKELNKTFFLLSNTNNISFDNVLSLYGSKNVNSILLANNSLVLPFFGPQEARYYSALLEEQLNMLNKLQSLQETVEGLNLTITNNNRIISSDKDDSTIEIASFNYGFTVNITNNNFALEIYDNVSGSSDCEFNNSLDLAIRNKVKFTDFSENITLESQRNLTLMFFSEVVATTNNNQENLDWAISIQGIFGILILKAIIFLKKIKK